MLTKEQNELLTRTGPGTPGGRLFRRYWQPVALAEELPPGAEPQPVRLLGEDLVLFRDAKENIGLMALRCPHRGADLSYARVEGEGLRCLYHGWLIARNGRCLDQPGEPAASDYKDKIRHPAYPCREAGGLILTYMGPGEPPPLPDFAFLSAPASHVWTSKLLHECNYLQGNEGNVDPQHLSFLHRMASPNKARDERQKQVDALMGANLAPVIHVEETAYGLRLSSTRALPDDKKYVRVTNFIMPNNSAFDGGPLQDPAKSPPKPNVGYWMHWHVPIDDTHHWKYAVAYCYDSPIDKEYQHRSVRSEVTEDFDSRRRRSNRYLQDRREMENTTFLGMGFNFYDHDRFAVESQGAISDRTRENLGVSDRAIMAMRRQMLRAIEDMERGEDPLLAGRNTTPAAVADLVVVSQTVPASVDSAVVWRDYRADGKKSAAAPALAK
jgi:phenylpropionate dioxygenase-like ring-hydroxylating dioxygenase large terminal subunit